MKHPTCRLFKLGKKCVNILLLVMQQEYLLKYSNNEFNASTSIKYLTEMLHYKMCTK